MSIRIPPAPDVARAAEHLDRLKALRRLVDDLSGMHASSARACKALSLASAVLVLAGVLMAVLAAYIVVNSDSDSVRGAVSVLLPVASGGAL